MSPRLLLVVVTLLGLASIDLTAQVNTRSGLPVLSSRPAPTPPIAPGVPPAGRPNSVSRPAPAPPSQPLPVPFAGTVPDPIMRGTSPDVMRTPSRDVFRAAPSTYGRLSALRGSSYNAGFGYSVYGDGGYIPYAPNVADEPPAPRNGRLNLFVSPASAQVFVDGLYEGTVAHFQDRGLWLDAGARHIELHADGYEPATFDVRIAEDQTVEYRKDLPRLEARPEAPRVAAAPKTFYVIPGCYAGDTPPGDGQLPSGCSATSLKTVPPVVNSVSAR